MTNVFITGNKQPLNLDLAVVFGVNESIVLEKIHYWINKNKEDNRNFHDGLYWTFNSYKKWQEDNFPFWSVDTIRRIFRSLEKMNCLIATDKYNKKSYDQTKWYSLNYEEIEKILATQGIEYSLKQTARGGVQDAQEGGADCIGGG